jgi:hypothetical protein
MEDELYKKAKERVNEIRGFYIHLIVYIIMNVVFIYFIGRSWLWVTAFWGMGLLFQLVNTFLLGKEWEEKKIREYIEKEEKEDNKKEENN